MRPKDWFDMEEWEQRFIVASMRIKQDQDEEHQKELNKAKSRAKKH